MLPTGLTAALSSPDSFIQTLQTANTTIANGISGGAANAYSVLLPTAADSGPQRSLALATDSAAVEVVSAPPTPAGSCGSQDELTASWSKGRRCRAPHCRTCPCPAFDRLFAISANSKLSGGAETAAPATVLADSGTPAHPREPANVESYTDPRLSYHRSLKFLEYAQIP